MDLELEGSPRTFLGVNSIDLREELPSADIVVFGASDATPYNPGVTSHAATAPMAIRRALKDYESDLLAWDFDQGQPLLDINRITVLDAGNLHTDPTTPSENRRMIRDAAKTIIASGAIPILIGGDDSVPIPFMEAFNDGGDLIIIQIDAHLDWMDNLDGLRHTYSSTMHRASEMPWVKKIIQVGMRGVGGSHLEELQYAKQWGSHIFPALQVKEQGMQPIIEQIDSDSRCLITIDCDGLDPSVIPGVIIPQHGGLTYHDVITLLEGVFKKANVVGVDLVELAPELDVRGLGSLAAARILCNVIGCIGRRKLSTGLP